MTRVDIRTSTPFRTFMDLDSQMPESVTYQPFKLGEISNLSLGGRDFVYV